MTYKLPPLPDLGPEWTAYWTKVVHEKMQAYAIAAMAPLLERIANLQTSCTALRIERDDYFGKYSTTCDTASLRLKEIAQQASRIAELEQQLSEARKQMEAHKDEWLSWEAKRKALERDAERYRWLRDVAHPDYGPAVADHQCNDWGKWYYSFPSAANLDAANDAAMKKGQQ